MKSSVKIVATAVGLLMTAWALAAEPPHLQFVKGLRERNMPDLALEYLLKLSKNPPPDIASLVPLELAQTRVELSNLQADPGQKLGILRQARAEFEDFVKKNPGSPLTAQANVEIAKVIGMEGRSMLSQAARQENVEAQQREAIPAKPLLEHAGALLKEAVPKIDAQLSKLPESPKMPQEKAARDTLTRAKLMAEYEQGLNLIDQGLMYRYLDDGQARGKALNEAIAVLKRVSDRDLTSPLCWQAKAWVGRAYQETDQPDEAKKVYNLILNEKANAAAAETAKRQAGYYLVLLEARDTQAKTRWDNVLKSGEKWLDDFKTHDHTSEGYGVKYLLGRALFEKAKGIEKVGPNKDTLTPAARDLFTRADRYFRSVVESENDYTDLAREWRKQILILSPPGGGSTKTIAELATFEECQARAEREVALMGKDEATMALAIRTAREKAPNTAAAQQEVEKKVKEMQRKLEDTKRDRYDTIAATLERGLLLASADGKVSVADIGEARFMLAFVYLLDGDLYRAAVLGEHQARSLPKHTRSPGCAAYALQAYAQLVARGEREGSPAEELAADRDKIKRLAEYMERQWPTDSATDFARHQLGSQLLKDGKYPEASDVLGRITSRYLYYPMARYQLALTLYDLSKTKDKEEKPDPQKKAYRERAEQVLQQTTLDTGDPEAAAAFIRCKLLLGQFLYEAKRYEEMEKSAAAAQARVQKIRLSEKSREELLPALAAQGLYARYGRANDLIQAGQFAKVREIAEPAIKEMAAQLKGGGAVSDSAARVRRSLAVLALQALVQENKMDEAQKLLDLLQKYAAADDDLGGGAIAVLVQMLQQLKEQIAELEKKSSSPAAKTQLANTKKSYGKFLDILSGQKKLPPEMGLFLATSYASLDQHAKAAALLEKVTEPEGFKLEAPQPLDDEEKKIPERLQAFLKAADEYNRKLQEYTGRMQSYRSTQIMLIRELRLAGKEAKDSKEKADYFERCRVVLNKAAATDWGRKSFEVQRERVQLLEDQERYGGADGAINGWNNLMKQITPSDENRKRQYFDCYYHLTYCFYKNALKVPDEKKKQQYIKQAAGFITKLETSEPTFGGDHLKDMYKKLLDAEAPLKAEYKAQGGKVF